jgi:hypothetical protein
MRPRCGKDGKVIRKRKKGGTSKKKILKVRQGDRNKDRGQTKGTEKEYNRKEGGREVKVMDKGAKQRRKIKD